MPANSPALSPASLKKAIEGRNAGAMSGFFTDNAVIRIIDRINTPSKPREVKGKAEVAAYWADICGRDMAHKVEGVVADDKRLSFSESCMYPGGPAVHAIGQAELKGGRIAKMTVLQAWDE
jgi:SnoaL-like domain